MTGTGRPPHGQSVERLDWATVLGFATMALLWPVLDLTGVLAVLHPVAGVALAVGLPGVAWVLGAAYGGVPRPLLTLTLAGALAGIILVVWSYSRGAWPELSPVRILAGVGIELARSTVLGALAGLLASGLRRAHRGR